MKPLWKIIIMFGFGLAFCYWLFSKSPKTIYKTETTTDTIYGDTITHYITTKPIVKYIERPSDTVTVIDTQYVLIDYNSYVYYDSTLIDDSSLYFHYDAVVFQNRCKTFDYEYKLKKPIIVNKSTTVIKPRPKVYVSALVGGNSKRFNYGVMVQYQNNKLIWSSAILNDKTVVVGVGLGF